MQRQSLIHFKAFFLLFIIAISSVGMPLITHSCSHDNQKDIHLFSSDHHCEDECSSNEEVNNSLSFKEMPCCSFETDFLTNENLLSSKKEITNKHVIILSSLFYIQKKIENKLIKQTNNKPYKHKLYGYQYRIAMQSFLC